MRAEPYYFLGEGRKRVRFVSNALVDAKLVSILAAGAVRPLCHKQHVRALEVDCATKELGADHTRSSAVSLFLLSLSLSNTPQNNNELGTMPRVHFGVAPARPKQRRRREVR